LIAVGHELHTIGLEPWQTLEKATFLKKHEFFILTPEFDLTESVILQAVGHKCLTIRLRRWQTLETGTFLPEHKFFIVTPEFGRTESALPAMDKV
jgi:hypothetical protein